ncbi:MAG: hypothetical protein ABUT39_13175 [Acidobacteriota bacterium]
MDKETKVELEIRLNLPDSLAREAKDNGLLDPMALEILLREELRRRRIDGLFQAADRLASLPLAPLTDEEVESEIHAVRAQRRANAGGR